MTTWEYKVVPNWEVADEEYLNKLGNEGWELVHVEKKPLGFARQQLKVWYFKRPKQIMSALHEHWKMKSQTRLGRAILEHMVNQGINQGAFAKRVGLSQSAVSRIISGFTPSPHGPTLDRLAQELGIGTRGEETVRTGEDYPVDDP